MITDLAAGVIVLGSACTLILMIVLLPGVIYTLTWRPWKLFRARFHPKVTGYKGFRPDLVCDLGPAPFQYEIGKTYAEEGDPSVCDNGFHFCKQLKHVFDHYPPEKGCVYCKVEALGKVDTNRYGKSCTDVIRIVHQLSPEEVRRVLRDQRRREEKAKKKRRKKRKHS